MSTGADYGQRMMKCVLQQQTVHVSDKKRNNISTSEPPQDDSQERGIKTARKFEWGVKEHKAKIVIRRELIRL